MMVGTVQCGNAVRRVVAGARRVFDAASCPWAMAPSFSGKHGLVSARRPPLAAVLVAKNVRLRVRELVVVGRRDLAMPVKRGVC